MNQSHVYFYLSVLAASFGFGMFMYFVPVFAQTFGASFLDLGLIGSANAFAYAISPMLIGLLADRCNRAWMLALALILNILMTIILGLSRSLRDVMILWTLGGLAYGTFWPMADVLAAELATFDALVREMGSYCIIWGAGLLMGPFLGGYVIQMFGFTWLFMFSGLVLSAALATVVLFFARTYRRQTAKGAVTAKTDPGSIRKAVPLYMILIFYSVVMGVIDTMLPGYASSEGLMPTMIGVVFTSFGIARVVMFAMFAMSEEYSRVRVRRALSIASAILTLGILAIAVFPNFFGFLLVAVLIGGSAGMVFPLTYSLVSVFFPEKKMGAAMGSYETVLGVGFAMGPLMAGLVAATVSIELTFVVTSLFGMLMTGLAMFERTYWLPPGRNRTPIGL